MSTIDLDRIVEQVLADLLVEEISNRVVARLLGRPRSALVLVTGTDIGLGKAMGSLRGLREAGWTLRFVLSAEARRLLTPDRLRDLNAEMLIPFLNEASASGAAEADIETLLAGCGVVVVPALSITTAAKVAVCIRDSLPSRLLARALERGTRVVVASDGACPDVRERAAQLFRVTDAYKARLRATLSTLADYGVEVVRARDLAGAVQGRLAMTAPDPRGAPVVSLGAAGPKTLVEKRVFSRSDAVQWSASELRLAPGVLLTPAAADELRARNVRVSQA